MPIFLVICVKSKKMDPQRYNTSWSVTGRPHMYKKWGFLIKISPFWKASVIRVHLGPVSKGHCLTSAKWCTLMHGLDVGHICWIHKWRHQEMECHGSDVNELYGNFCNVCNVIIFIQLLQVLMTILLKRFLIRIILMGRRRHLAASRTFLKLLRLQRLHGWARQEGLITVVTTLLPMHLCSVSGKLALIILWFLGSKRSFIQTWLCISLSGTWISWAWHQNMIPRLIADKA